MHIRILLIEREAAIQQVANRLFCEFGCKVDSTAELAHAKHMLAGRGYEIVLLDLSMPLMNIAKLIVAMGRHPNAYHWGMLISASLEVPRKCLLDNLSPEMEEVMGDSLKGQYQRWSGSVWVRKPLGPSCRVAWANPWPTAG